MTVWKYTLTPSFSSLEMPIGAHILHVHEQHGEICIWALVDPQAKSEFRTFHVAGTGHELPKGELRYWGTVHVPPFVWHVFEVIA